MTVSILFPAVSFDYPIARPVGKRMIIKINCRQDGLMRSIGRIYATCHEVRIPLPGSIL